MSDPSINAEAIQRLKQEMDALIEQHSKSLQEAIYAGMTTDEAKQHDRRREEISRLSAELEALKKVP